jgi:hypothetical protein
MLGTTTNNFVGVLRGSQFIPEQPMSGKLYIHRHCDGACCSNSTLPNRRTENKGAGQRRVKSARSRCVFVRVCITRVGACQMQVYWAGTIRLRPWLSECIRSRTPFKWYQSPQVAVYFQSTLSINIRTCQTSEYINVIQESLGQTCAIWLVIDRRFELLYPVK